VRFLRAVADYRLIHNKLDEYIMKEALITGGTVRPKEYQAKRWENVERMEGKGIPKVLLK
jgi:hypothetical protein